MRYIYNFFIYCYYFGIKIASLFNNRKAKLFISGRNEQFSKLIHFTENNNKPIILIHCASLGEFEQGRPLIEKIKTNYTQYSIILTFFSPSGYEVRKDYKMADYVCYLPIDTIKNAKKIVKIIKPQKTIFVKYEFWFNLLYQLHKNKIPIYFISTIFRSNQHFFKFYGKWFLKHIKYAKIFFTQNQETTNLLTKYNIRASTCGDTRFDRVFDIAQQKKQNDKIENFVNDKLITIVAGSTWKDDELLLEKLLKERENIQLIIAPHEVDESHIQFLSNIFSSFGVQLYSENNISNINRVLIINTIGILSSLYRYSKFSYIGGGFGAGIHNILEPLAYGKPVIFGPKYQKFDEAKTIIYQQGSFSINNFEQLLTLSNKLITDKLFYKETCKICSQFVNLNIGATEKILLEIF